MKNRFVVIAPMHNASRTLPRMLHSIVGQSYENWKIILIDDVSDEYHRNIVNRTLSAFRDVLDVEGINSDKIQIIWNDTKKWEVENVLQGLLRCEDEDIVVRVDPDDWLVDLDAFAIIDQIYTTTSCDVLWSAHRWGYSDKNISGPMSEGSDPYTQPWVASHLKTFRKRLLNEVPYENFLNQRGELVRRAGDQAIYLPCLHLSKRRVFLPRVLYHYSIDEQNGLVYQTDDAKFQKSEADFLRLRGFVTKGISWENELSKNTRSDH